MLIVSNTNHSKMYQKVFHAVLNKIALTKCAVEQTQNYRFQPFLPSFYWKAMLPTQTNMAIFVLRDSKSTQNDISFLFSFTHLYFNCQFAILVGHFKLEKLMENAGSQSQTMSWAEKHNISIWRKLYKKWKRESAAKWIRKRAIIYLAFQLILQSLNDLIFFVWRPDHYFFRSSNLACV